MNVGDVGRPSPGLPKTLFRITKRDAGPLILNPLQNLHILHLYFVILSFPKRPIEGPGVHSPRSLLFFLGAHNPGDLLEQQPILPLDLRVLSLHHQVSFGVIRGDDGCWALPYGPD